MRKSVVLFIIVIVALIGVLVFVFIRKDETSSAEIDAAIESFQEAPEPLSPPAPETGPDVPSAPEVKFDNELAFTGFVLTVDDQKSQRLPCSRDPETPATVGRLALDETNWATLTCTEIHMGSVGLSYRDQDEQMKRVDLALQDGDAGETYDLRAWIRRDPVSRLLEIDTIAFESSSDDPEEPCRVRAEHLRWNSQTMTFDRKETAPNLEKVVPPVNAAQNCLDEKGRWSVK